MTNKVTLSGTCVVRRDELGDHRVPRTILELFNPEVADVFRATFFGRQAAMSLGPEIRPGVSIEIEGRLTAVRWRTPDTGKLIREIGIEAQGLRVLADPGDQQDCDPASTLATPAQAAELRRRAGQLGLDEVALQRYLHSRPPEALPAREVTPFLLEMAQQVQEVEARLQQHGQLDHLMATAAVPAAGDTSGDDNGRHGL